MVSTTPDPLSTRARNGFNGTSPRRKRAIPKSCDVADILSFSSLVDYLGVWVANQAIRTRLPSQDK
eukprot:2648818-Pyramimonas_sp.AAC.1